MGSARAVAVLGLLAASTASAWAGVVFDQGGPPRDALPSLFAQVREAIRGGSAAPAVGREVTVCHPRLPAIDHRGGSGDLHAPTRGDFYGYCPDYDHSNFEQAKAFAYGSAGLNYGNQEANEWAWRYVQTHACGTIAQYKARFRALYEYAYGSSFLNMDSSEARAFALRGVEYVLESDVRAWMNVFSPTREFFYSSNYMNLSSQDAGRRADAWVRRDCGDIRPIKDFFRREYDFAYKSNGLNLSSSEARRYAVVQVSRMTHCDDLLR